MLEKYKLIEVELSYDTWDDITSFEYSILITEPLDIMFCK